MGKGRWFPSPPRERLHGCLIGLATSDPLGSKTTGVAVILALAIAVLSWNTAKADVVIQAEKAAIRTEGGPASGGGWNLWSNGHVGDVLLQNMAKMNVTPDNAEVAVISHNHGDHTGGLVSVVGEEMGSGLE